MNFLEKNERNTIKNFLNKGYLIHNVERKKSLTYIYNLIKTASSKILKKKNIELNYIHKIV